VDASPPVVSVRFGPAGRLQTFLLSTLPDPPFATREDVIVETEHGQEPARVEALPHAVMARRSESQVQPLTIRRATPADAIERLKHEQRAAEARRYAMERIRAQQLPMKLSRVEQTPDAARLVFYFTSDVRVDFRELVRELAARFHTRIEMRQIGVRDEARMLGGYGSCGRPLCCTTWLTTFEPISIRMAKQQDLALNPSKLSGLCGRLKCCLRYELPNAKGIVNGGCGDEGACGNPSGCGTGAGCGSSCSCGRR
jgi:cell fate regulator YaaT (PSP1 superfamily)